MYIKKSTPPMLCIGPVFSRVKWEQIPAGRLQTSHKILVVIAAL